MDEIDSWCLWTALTRQALQALVLQAVTKYTAQFFTWKTRLFFRLLD